MRFIPAILVSSSLFFGLSLTAYAKPVAKERLDAVNQFVMAQVQAQGRSQDGWSGGFVSAEEDDAGMISKLEIEIIKNEYDYKTKKVGAHEGAAKFSMSINNNDIEMAINGDFKFHV